MSALVASAFLTVALSVGLHMVGSSTAHAAATTTTSAPSGSSSALDPRIAAIVRRHPAEKVSVIIQFNSSVSPERARWLVARDGGHVVAQLHIINAVAATLPAKRALWLAGNPAVHSVSLNGVVHSQSLAPISPYLLNNLQNTYDSTLNLTPAFTHGYTGAGVGVAVIDTGIDGNLPDFQSSNGSGSRVIGSAVIDPNASTAADMYGHGTDVAGIIAGNSLNRSPGDASYGKFVGVAPNANLISIKASDDQGASNVLDVIYALQFAVDHQAEYNIRVINMSLDSTTPQSYMTDPLDAAAESAWMHGIVVVAAAGNRGSASDAVQFAPANDPYVITVGAVDENGQPNPSNDTVPSWSSQGTTQDGVQKPDVYAPGAHIVSVLAPNSAFANLCPACIVNNNYIRTGGTSMAAPMISGLVADALQYRPTLTPNQVKGILMAAQVSGNSQIQIPDAMKMSWLWNAPVANQGLTPNSLITNPQGDIDYSRSSWSRSSWSTASGALTANWSMSSWSMSSWSMSSWSTNSWSANSWSTYWG